MLNALVISPSKQGTRILMFVVLGCFSCGKDKQTKQMSPLPSHAALIEPPAPTTEEPEAIVVDQSLLVRNQLSSNGITPWNGGVVTKTVPFYFVDVANAKSSLLTVTGQVVVLDVATYQGRPAALGKRADGRLIVSVQQLNGTHAVTHPLKLATHHAASHVLAADDEHLVVWEPERLHCLDGLGWKVKPIPPLPQGREFPKGISHVLLAHGRLWLGYDFGEWGGAFHSLDLTTLRWRVEQGGDAAEDLPTRGIFCDHEGNIWVVRGLAHGLLRGALHRLDGAAWTLVTGSDHERHLGDWNLPPASLDAFAVDRTGRAHLATTPLGLVRQEIAGGWKQITTPWPRSVFLNGLAFIGEIVVLSTYDSGLLLLDQARGTARRVTFPLSR